MRRVVTGHSTDGKVIFTSDTEVNPVSLGPGWDLFPLWGAREIPEFPNDGAVPDMSRIRPDWHRPGSYLFSVTTIPSHSRETRGPGFHSTDTIDFICVLSGEVWLELDDGQETCLKPGDTVVQNGVQHCWNNKGIEPCRIAVCMIGAKRK